MANPDSVSKASSAWKGLWTERLLGRLSLPYPLGALIAAAIVGPPGHIAFLYLGVLNLQQVLFFLQESPSDLISTTLTSVLTFYALIAINQMRFRVMKAEKEIVPILPSPEFYRTAFGPMTRKKQPIVLAGILGLAFAVPESISLVATNQGYNLVHSLVVALICYPVLATFIWVFYSCAHGVFKLGKYPLSLKNFQEDRTLGARPFGSLMLWLTLIFFVGVALGTLLLDFAPEIGLQAPQAIALISSLAVAGSILFFMPLWTTHRQMLDQKQRQIAAIRSGYSNSIDPPGLHETSTIFKNPLQLLAFDVLERRATVASTWPFDIAILSKLVLIVISATAAVLARLIILALNL